MNDRPSVRVRGLIALLAVITLFQFGVKVASAEEFLGIVEGRGGALTILECNNVYSDPIQSEIQVFDHNRRLRDRITVNLAGHETAHYIVDGMTGRYGLYQVEIGPREEGLNCISVVYKLTAPGSALPLEYVYAHPMLQPQSGEVSGFFKLANPDSTNPQLVRNVISLINLGDSSFSGIVELRRRDGRVLTRLRIDGLGLKRQRSIVVNNVTTELSGSYRVIPDGNARYAVFERRISWRGEQAVFALPLYGQQGSCDLAPLFVSTQGAATNNIELGNATGRQLRLTYRLRNAAGAVIRERAITLGARASRELNIGQFLGTESNGTFQILCPPGDLSDPKVLMQSIFYGRASAGSQTVRWARGESATEERAFQGADIVISFNSNLTATNINSFADESLFPAQLAFRMRREDGRELLPTSYQLLPGGIRGVNPTNRLAPNSIGYMVVQSDTQTSLFDGHSSRRYRDSAGRLYYAMTVPRTLFYSQVGADASPCRGRFRRQCFVSSSSSTSSSSAVSSSFASSASISSSSSGTSRSSSASLFSSSASSAASSAAQSSSRYSSSVSSSSAGNTSSAISVRSSSQSSSSAASSSSPSAGAAIGFNLGWVQSNQSQIIFVDVFKQSGVNGLHPWTPGTTPSLVTTFACGNGLLESHEEQQNSQTVTVSEECDDSNTVNGDGCTATCLLEYDSLGWPIRLPIRGQFVRTQMLNSGALYPAGTYTLMFDGLGTIQLGRDASGTFDKTTVGTGTYQFNVTSPSASGISLGIMRSEQANPVRNIKVIMPGYLSTYQAHPFYPPFVDRVRGSRVIRFMDWLRTNGQLNGVWSNRTTLNHASQTGSRGAAYEYALSLSNIVGADPWINIPHLANDDYIRQLARLVLAANLAPERRIYLEYSNELWNGSFDQTAYVRSEGLRLGLDTHSTVAGRKYVAKRSAEIFRIFEEEFGAQSNRLVKVIPAQASNAGVASTILSAFSETSINNVPINPHGVSADVLAIAPYFGNGLADAIGDAGEIDSITVPQILDRLSSTYLSTTMNQFMPPNKPVADSYGLTLVAYEGGSSLRANNSNYQDNPTLTQKLTAASRDPRMEGIYRTYLNAWFAITNGVFNHYMYVDLPSQYGSWGALEHLDQPLAEAHKYRVLQEFLLGTSGGASSSSSVASSLSSVPASSAPASSSSSRSSSSLAVSSSSTASAVSSSSRSSSVSSSASLSSSAMSSSSSNSSVASGSVVISLNVVPTRSSCVAPCAIWFDASGTTATSGGVPMSAADARLALDYYYVYDTSLAASLAPKWARGALARNSANTAPSKNEDRDTGVVGFHVYEQPGTYTARVTVSHGSTTASTTRTIQVIDPGASGGQWAGANTVCVYTTTRPTPGTTPGCPSGATVVQVAEPNSLETAILTYCSGPKRCLFRRGETYRSANEITIATGSKYFGAYGSPTDPKPIWQDAANTAGNVFIGFEDNLSDFHFVDLEVRGKLDVVNLGSGVAFDASNNIVINRALWLRTNITRFDVAIYTHCNNWDPARPDQGCNLDAGDVHNQIAFVDSAAEFGTGAQPNLSNLANIYMTANYFAMAGSVSGNDLSGLVPPGESPRSGSSFNGRFKWIKQGYIAHNDWGLLDPNRGDPLAGTPGYPVLATPLEVIGCGHELEPTFRCTGNQAVVCRVNGQPSDQRCIDSNAGLCDPTPSWTIGGRGGGILTMRNGLNMDTAGDFPGEDEMFVDNYVSACKYTQTAMVGIAETDCGAEKVEEWHRFSRMSGNLFTAAHSARTGSTIRMVLHGKTQGLLMSNNVFDGTQYTQIGSSATAIAIQDCGSIAGLANYHPPSDWRVYNNSFVVGATTTRTHSFWGTQSDFEGGVSYPVVNGTNLKFDNNLYYDADGSGTLPGTFPGLTCCGGTCPGSCNLKSGANPWTGAVPFNNISEFTLQSSSSPGSGIAIPRSEVPRDILGRPRSQVPSFAGAAGVGGGL